MNTFAKIDRATFLRFAAEHPEQRFELERGRIVQQMTGGTRRHGIVARRISQILERQVDSSRWSVANERGVGVGDSERYPDVVVEPADEPLESLETERPSIIVEVLSPATTATDLNTKPTEYFAIASLDAYIVASQDEAAMLVWVRDEKGQFADTGREVVGIDRTVVVKTRWLTATLDLAEIYHGIA